MRRERNAGLLLGKPGEMLGTMTPALIRKMAFTLLSILFLGEVQARPRIELTAEETTMEKGVAIASGKVTFNDGMVTIRGERLEYSPAQQQLSCFGDAVAEINGIKITLCDVIYHLKTKQIAPMPIPAPAK